MWTSNGRPVFPARQDTTPHTPHTSTERDSAHTHAETGIQLEPKPTSHDPHKPGMRKPHTCGGRRVILRDSAEYPRPERRSNKRQTHTAPHTTSHHTHTHRAKTLDTAKRHWHGTPLCDSPLLVGDVVFIIILRSWPVTGVEKVVTAVSAPSPARPLACPPTRPPARRRRRRRTVEGVLVVVSSRRRRTCPAGRAGMWRAARRLCRRYARGLQASIPVGWNHGTYSMHAGIARGSDLIHLLTRV